MKKGKGTLWRQAILVLGCFGASGYLLDYYHAHVIASTMFFPSLHGSFWRSNKQCTFASVLRSDWVYVRILGLIRSAFFRTNTIDDWKSS